jgi:hypothetical protein
MRLGCIAFLLSGRGGHRTGGRAVSDNELSDYLVISRGKWDAGARPEDIQAAIDAFYPWIEGKIAEGRAKPGSRLAKAGATVSRETIVVDGPFGEAKEVVGGFWVLVARSLDEAVQIASENPCMKYGLFYEVRPLEDARCSAFVESAETPAK